MITFNNIITAIENFADNHFFIKSFSHGNIEEMDLDKYTQFPLLHVIYTGSTYDEGTKTYSFEIYIVDNPSDKIDKISYQREVISDSEQCAEDLLADLTNGGNIFAFWDYELTNATITPLEEETKNVLSGVVLDISIQVPYQYDSCNAPLTGVTPTDTCPDAEVEVNGNAYGSVASGSVIDVLVRYVNGTPVGTIVGNVVEIPNPVTCDDADVNVNGVAYGTVPAGGTENVIVENTLGNQVGSLVGSDWQVPNGAVVNSDATYSGSSPSGGSLTLPDITITLPNGTTTSFPAAKNFNSTTYKSGIAYKRPFYSQKTSYATGDEGNNFANGLYEFTPPAYPLYYQHLDYTVAVANVYKSLAHDNVWGNRTRFTQPNGTAISGNGAGLVIVDHLTGLAWWGTNEGTATWSNAFSLVATANSANRGGYSDWRLPTAGELYTTFNDEGASAAWTTPFENWSSNIIWTSTTNPSTTSQAKTGFSGRLISAQAKSVSTNRVVLVRTFYP